MCIQPQRLILCQNTYRINSGINTVAKRKINYPVLSPKCYRRLGNLGRQNTETASLPTCQQHCNHFLLNHVITSSFFVNQVNV